MRYLTKSAHVLSKWSRGFTLVELLVVIAIIAILAAIVILIVNPLEITRRTRDATRFADLTSIQNAINVTVQESSSTGLALLCVGTASGTSCSGKSVDVGANNANGTGWVKVDLTQQSAMSVPNLPLDPTNTSGATGNHYTYCGQVTATASTWEINTNLESARETPRETTDGGNDNALYEVGSQPGLNLIGGTGPCSF